MPNRPSQDNETPRPLRSSEEDRDLFEMMFYHDLESWFSADIACCDICYGDFVASWPHAYSADDAAFQRAAIGMSTFYSGSYLQEEFTKEEFDELVKGLSCPRCGAPLTGFIWPYELPFMVDKAWFEKAIAEIAEIANQRPFLLLTHEFARKVHTTIHHVASSLSETAISGKLYRARRFNESLVRELAEFDSPPRETVKEGRYNHAGNPVLYLASDLETCFEEMRREPCVAIELAFETTLRVLDLVSPRQAHPKHEDELMAITYSALVSAPQPDTGWHKPAYVISRFLADCARDAGIQAIRYPSTRMKKDSYNLVILDPAFRLAEACTVTRYVDMP